MGAIVVNETVDMALEFVSMLPAMTMDVDIHPHVERSARTHLIGDNVDRSAAVENLARPDFGNSDEFTSAIYGRKLMHTIPFLFRFPILIPISYHIFQIFQGKSRKIFRRFRGGGNFP